MIRKRIFLLIFFFFNFFSVSHLFSKNEPLCRVKQKHMLNGIQHVLTVIKKVQCKKEFLKLKKMVYSKFIKRSFLWKNLDFEEEGMKKYFDGFSLKTHLKISHRAQRLYLGYVQHKNNKFIKYDGIKHEDKVRNFEIKKERKRVEDGIKDQIKSLEKRIDNYRKLIEKTKDMIRYWNREMDDDNVSKFKKKISKEKKLIKELKQKALKLKIGLWERGVNFDLKPYSFSEEAREDYYKKMLKISKGDVKKAVESLSLLAHKLWFKFPESHFFLKGPTLKFSVPYEVSQNYQKALNRCYGLMRKFAIEEIKSGLSEIGSVLCESNLNRRKRNRYFQGLLIGCQNANTLCSDLPKMFSQSILKTETIHWDQKKEVHAFLKNSKLEPNLSVILAYVPASHRKENIFNYSNALVLLKKGYIHPFQLNSWKEVMKKKHPYDIDPFDIVVSEGGLEKAGIEADLLLTQARYEQALLESGFRLGRKLCHARTKKENLKHTYDILEKTIEE